MLAKQKWQIRTIAVLERVFEERLRQVDTYGHNDELEDGTGPESRWLLPTSSNSATVIQDQLREQYEEYEEETGKPTWVHLVREEIAEAFQEDDPARLTEELVQVAALCVSWVETIEGRQWHTLRQLLNVKGT